VLQNVRNKKITVPKALRVKISSLREGSGGGSREVFRRNRGVGGKSGGAVYPFKKEEGMM